MALEDAGTVSFWVNHDNKGWATDDQQYFFPPIKSEDLEVVVIKHFNKSREPNTAIEFKMAIGSKWRKDFIGPIPEISEKGLFVAITWKKGGEITLLLNGQEVISEPYN